MTRNEKMLIHQIHQAKLLVDFGTSFASTCLIWNQRWLCALLVAFVPSILVTALLVAYADLDRLRSTRFGAYVVRHMAPFIVGCRIVGQLVTWGGAALHIAWLVPLGYFVIILAWSNGLWDEARPLLTEQKE